MPGKVDSRIARKPSSGDSSVDSLSLVELQRQLSDIKAQLTDVLNVMQARLSRPYYCLDDGWALTHLDTGQPFFINTRDRNVTPWLLMGGHWETNVDVVMSAYVRPGMFVADIGAHMGYYTVKLGSLVGPTGKIFSFEPNPEMNAYTERNISINGVNAELQKIGLGDKPGVATISFVKGNLAQASLTDIGKADFSFKVEVDTLDNVMRSARPLDLIKLDAEGYEPMILKGARAPLNRSPNCALMLELNMDRWEQFAKLEELPELIGEHRLIYAVTDSGKLVYKEFSELRSFLSGCFLTENYFLFCPPTVDAMGRVEPLILR